MKASEKILINATPSQIWSVISDIANMADMLSQVESIEIVSKPHNGLNGLVWKETRMMFERPITQKMKVKKAVENELILAVGSTPEIEFETRMEIVKGESGNYLKMSFEGEAKGLANKMLAGFMSVMTKRATKKNFLKDLKDYKTAIEK